MRFGLAVALGTFERLMREVFMQELDEFVTVYLDDVLVFSRKWEKHDQHLKGVPAKLREHRLLLKKCYLPMRGVTHRGFLMSAQGMGPDPDKTRALREWPEALANRQQARAFLGAVGYYTRLMSSFNEAAPPLPTPQGR